MWPSLYLTVFGFALSVIGGILVAILITYSSIGPRWLLSCDRRLPGRSKNRRSLLCSSYGSAQELSSSLLLAFLIAFFPMTINEMTLPWLPLGTFSYAFVAKKMGFWEKRGLDVTIDRGFGSGKVCVPVDQGQYDFGILDLAVMMNCAARGLDLVAVAGVLASFSGRHFLAQGIRHHQAAGFGRPDRGI